MVEDWQLGGFGLYVHWPFCEAKCPYCDFNSHVSRQIDQSRWAKALALEIKRVGALTQGRVLNSIFFGGGTPSLMAVETVESVLEAASDTWVWANDIEITLEANPSSVEADKFLGFRNAGVNRVSLGVQSLRDDDLKRLGRLHNVDEARRALDIAKNVFDRVSFDLIYARQNQTLAEWETELTEALALAADHLSLYQLTIEQGTAFGDRYNAGKLRGLPNEDISADMFELTQAVCESHGMPAYEVSNHAKPGAESRHNLIYWRYGDYAGVGPGAHGRLSVDGAKFATDAVLQPGAWLQKVEQGHGSDQTVALSGVDQAAEYLMMGLRIQEGIDLDRLHKMQSDETLRPTIGKLVNMDLLWEKKGRLGVTPGGKLLLNSVLVELLGSD